MSHQDLESKAETENTLFYDVLKSNYTFRHDGELGYWIYTAED